MGLFSRWAEKRRAPSLSNIYIVESDQLAFEVGPLVATVLGKSFHVKSLRHHEAVPTDGYVARMDAILTSFDVEPVEALRQVMLNLKERV